MGHLGFFSEPLVPAFLETVKRSKQKNVIQEMEMLALFIGLSIWCPIWNGFRVVAFTAVRQRSSDRMERCHSDTRRCPRSGIDLSLNWGKCATADQIPKSSKCEVHSRCSNLVPSFQMASATLKKAVTDATDPIAQIVEDFRPVACRAERR